MRRNSAADPDSVRILRIDRMATPIGEALLVCDDAGRLRALDWAEKEARLVRQMRETYAPAVPVAGEAPAAVRRAFGAYFEGELHALGSIAWRAAGSPFQLAVWTALTTIAVGETLSYGELALRLGNPRAVRAVGLANGSNPISIVVPCHRVIGADGSLTGYGGGLDRKRWLLQHEAPASGAQQGRLFA